MKDNGRFWLAAALAPLSVPALYVLMSLYSGAIFQLFPFVNYLAAIAVVSYIGFLVFGLPFVLILRFKGKLTLVALFIGGVIAGPLFHVFMLVWSGDKVTFRGADGQMAILMTALSVVVAIVFGLIAKARLS